MLAEFVSPAIGRVADQERASIPTRAAAPVPANVTRRPTGTPSHWARPRDTVAQRRPAGMRRGQSPGRKPIPAACLSLVAYLSLRAGQQSVGNWSTIARSFQFNAYCYGAR